MAARAKLSVGGRLRERNSENPGEAGRLFNEGRAAKEDEAAAAGDIVRVPFSGEGRRTNHIYNRGAACARNSSRAPELFRPDAGDL